MKTKLKLSALCIAVGMAILVSCKSDDSPLPAPQVSSSKSSIAIAADASDTLTLTIVAPAKFASISATVDNGSVVVDEITGTNTLTGTARLIYTATDDLGNFTIAVTVTDGEKKTGTTSIGVSVSAKAPVTLAAGNISGSLERNTTYIAEGSLVVPQDQSLTIPEGVTIIFDGDGSQGSAEFTVNGNLYCKGTKELPIYFTLPEAKRVASNIYAGLWGGVQATTTCSEMVLQYTNINYCGAPAGSSNGSVLAGAYSEGTSRYGLLFSNNSGKLVIQNSKIAYTKDDGMRVLGGTILISNNVFESCGSTGGESVNIKSGTTGDVAYNVLYSSATNGFKISNVSGSAPTPQTNINVYNNTVLNGGYRQTATSAHGGSINMEKGARGQIYNNMVVNCKFGTRITTDADTVNIKVGYNLYYGNDDVIAGQFYPTASWINSKAKKEVSKDVSGSTGDNDPKFVNFTVTNFVSSDAASTSNPAFLGTYDLHLQSGSPAIGKGKSGFTVGTSIIAGGITYNVPAPSTYIGAFGTN